jgi:2-phospho-L-lactate/phosphoenolpyruvate guanylyltransferase
MERLAIIIPVKAPRDGKSRLAGVLPEHERHALNLQLFRHTLDQVAALTDIADVHVVSKSNEALAEARQRGFATCLEPEACDLNGAIALGAQQAEAGGACEIMVLPIDLPWLTSGRLRSVVDEFHAGADVMIITDLAADGTNVLLWRPIGTARFQYGIGSGVRHADMASALGLRITMRQDAELSFDLDTPQDLQTWSRDGGAANPFGATPMVRMVS